MAPRGKGTRGPKLTTIDWEEFHKLASYDCSQKEIADFFGISPETLENRYFDEYGEKLSGFWDKKKGTAKVKVKKAQFKLMESGGPGAVAMAIFLGKQYLGQNDKPLDQELLEFAQKSGLTRSDLLRLIENRILLDEKPNKKTFDQFSIDAGYPKPFPKQLEMQNFGMLEKEPRLLLGARGYGKTEYITILGLAYDIYLNPEDNTNLIITKSAARNAAIMEEIRNALEKNGVLLDKGNSKVLRTQGLLGQNHTVEAITIKTSMRGRHPKRIIMDDPVTDEDTSEAMRLLVKKKYDEAYKLCKNILIIGQPAHKFDLYAELRPKLKTMLVPHGTIPELDADLEAMRLAGVDPHSIEMSYNLTIPATGSTPFDNIKYMDKFPTGDSAVAFIDPSHEGGDYTAITILKQYMQGVAVVGFCFKKAWNHCVEDMLPIIRKYNVQKLAFETNALGDMPILMLRQVLPGVGVVGRRSNTNKHSRIMAAGSMAHLIHLSKESDKTYENLVVQYEYKAKNDDAPDSLASCLEWLGLIKGKV